MTNSERLDPGHYIGWVILVLLFVMSILQCKGQQKVVLDTVICKNECIDKIVELTSETAKKPKYYAVYNDLKNDVSELIPVSQNVINYINVCKSNKIKPSLGIKLKDGQIVSIIRYKKRYIKK